MRRLAGWLLLDDSWRKPVAEHARKEIGIAFLEDHDDFGLPPRVRGLPVRPPNVAEQLQHAMTQRRSAVLEHLGYDARTAPVLPCLQRSQGGLELLGRENWNLAPSEL
eukprot:6673576-Pyramimonas_sp.AAC.1